MTLSIKQFLTLLTILLFSIVSAQENETDTVPNFERDCILQSSDYYHPQFPAGWGNAHGHGDTLIVFSPNAPVRKKPATDGEIVTRLAIGQIVFITKYLEVKSTVEGVEAPWCEIDLNGQKVYVWTGALTRGFVQLSDGSFACWGLARIVETKDSYAKMASVRRFRDGVVLQRLDVNISKSSSENSGQLHLLCAPDLDGVQNILQLSTYGEACGLYSTDDYLAWDGTMLSYIASGFGMGDGGVLYDHQEVVFPYPDFATEEQRYTLYAYPNKNQLVIEESSGELNENCEWEEHSKSKLLTWPELTKGCWE